jgi:hypothetical protein
MKVSVVTLPVVSVTGADSRDIADSVNRDARVVRDGIGQRTDFLALVVDDVP